MTPGPRPRAPAAAPVASSWQLHHQAVGVVPGQSETLAEPAGYLAPGDAFRQQGRRPLSRRHGAIGTFGGRSPALQHDGQLAARGKLRIIVRQIVEGAGPELLVKL